MAGWGGARQGTPGKAYGNRSDLNTNRQAPAAPTGLPYGEHKAQIDAQRALPLPDNLTPLDAPTQRPTEHVMTGAPMGPGSGPEILGLPPEPGPDSAVADKLRAMYLAHPNRDLAELIADLNNGMA